ncbi:unnamed protein product [Blepharisma stoltei]|uniref:Protein kinase domain-containing protein n=1 Tax=Blepharisma stoltei TaxID=1481888 RepID=A0AAU9JN22_9CILI|nr:unnamed protein product [Blepharisma stoltei]
MMSNFTYFLLVFSVTVLYSITFGLCAIRTNKLKRFSEDWKQTKVFYITIMAQAFMRFVTYALLTWTLPRSETKNESLFLLVSVPDCLFIVSYVLLAHQMVSVFYYTHMENDIQLSLIIHFTRPKHKSVSKFIAYTISAWLSVEVLFFTLYFSDVLRQVDIELELALVNILSATILMLILLYLYINYSGTPFKSDASKDKLQRITLVTLLWTLGRYINGVLVLIDINSAGFVTEIYDERSTYVTACLAVADLVISEVCCFLTVIEYRFMEIFSYAGEDDRNRISAEVFTHPAKAISLSDDTATLSESLINPNPFIDASEITVSTKIGARQNGLGELYKCLYKGKELLYRKISFPRMSGYVLEEFNSEIINLKSIDSGYMVPFHGASFNLPSIGIITAYMPNGSLYFNLHEIKTRFTIQEKGKIIMELAQGLRELHSLGRVHGHLSSHNLVLDSQQKVKISDLGLEKIKKYAGVVISYQNKNAWSSPELLREASRTCVRAKPTDDIYSFGVIVWEIITEEIPYEGLNYSKMQQSVGHEGATPIIGSSFPSDLSKLVKSCWSVETEKRPNFKTICSTLSSIKWK